MPEVCRDAAHHERLVLGEGVIRVTVQPTLVGLRGGDHRVSAAVRMLGRVPVRRGIAAVRRAALLTRAQVHPIVAGFDAFIADQFPRMFDRSNRRNVCARLNVHSIASLR